MEHPITAHIKVSYENRFEHNLTLIILDYYSLITNWALCTKPPNCTIILHNVHTVMDYYYNKYIKKKQNHCVTHTFPTANVGVSTTRLRLPIKGFGGVGCKNLLSPRRPVRVGCGRLRPCEKSNMFDISPDPNRFIFSRHKQNVQSQASSGLLRPNLHSPMLSQAACDP